MITGHAPVTVRNLPFLGFRKETATEFLPTGLDPVDQLLGGCPRGRITEITGPESSGRTSLLHAVLASAGARGEYCAVVDTTDSFDPVTAADSGVSLETLVWVRCRGNLEHAVKSADLLLHAGGFGVVALDLCDAPEAAVRRIPISWWHRFRLAVEQSGVVFVVLAAGPQAKSCAAQAADLRAGEARFTGRYPHYLLAGARYTVESRRPVRPGQAGFHVEASRVS